MARLGLTSPWVTFYHEIEAFFKKDPEVRVIYDEDENVINLYVDNAAKASALTELLPTEKTFGAITIKVNVIPANRINVFTLTEYKANMVNQSLNDLYFAALNGNERFKEIIPVIGVFNNPITYILFKKEVVQYFNDSLGDFNGVCSTLMQNIAKDIFENTEGVYFCTDIKDPALNLEFATTTGTWNSKF